jgi:hypothetical protein
MQHWKWLALVPFKYPWSTLGSVVLCGWFVWELGTFGVWFIAAVLEVLAAVFLINSSFSLADSHLMNVHRLVDECVFNSRLLRAEFFLALCQTLLLWLLLDSSGGIIASCMTLYVCVEVWMYARNPSSRTISDDDAWKTGPLLVRTMRQKVAVHVLLLVVLMLYVGPGLSPATETTTDGLNEEVDAP